MLIGGFGDDEPAVTAVLSLGKGTVCQADLLLHPTDAPAQTGGNGDIAQMSHAHVRPLEGYGGDSLILNLKTIFKVIRQPGG